MIQHQQVYHEQEQRRYQEVIIDIRIGSVDGGTHIRLLQSVEALLEESDSSGDILSMDINPIGSLSNLLGELLIEASNDHLTLFVRQILTIPHRDRCTLLSPDTEDGDEGGLRDELYKTSSEVIDGIEASKIKIID